eukprot:16552-Heterococcus_DN1.PRE.5
MLIGVLCCTCWQVRGLWCGEAMMLPQRGKGQRTKVVASRLRAPAASGSSSSQLCDSSCTAKFTAANADCCHCAVLKCFYDTRSQNMEDTLRGACNSLIECATSLCAEQLTAFVTKARVFRAEVTLLVLLLLLAPQLIAAVPAYESSSLRRYAYVPEHILLSLFILHIIDVLGALAPACKFALCALYYSCSLIVCLLYAAHHVRQQPMRLKETLAAAADAPQQALPQVTSAMRLYLTNPMTQSILLTLVLRAVTDATSEIRGAIQGYDAADDTAELEALLQRIKDTANAANAPLTASSSRRAGSITSTVLTAEQQQSSDSQLVG